MKYERLDNIADIYDSLHQTPEYVSTGYPMVRVSDVRCGDISLSGCLFVDEDTFKKYTLKHIPKRGDIIISRVGTYGVFSYVNVDQLFCLGQNTAIISPKINGDYLYYFLSSSNARTQIEKVVVGSTQKTISLKSIKNLLVPIPSERTQAQIAKLLRTIDDEIAINKQINDNLEHIAALAFNEWLCGCGGNITIGELSDNILDYTPYLDDMVRLLNSSDVTEGVFPNAPLVPNKDLKGHFKKRFQYGDILYSEIRPRNHHYGFVLFDASEYIASTRLMVIRAISSKVSPAVLYQYLLLPSVEAEFTLKTESRSGTFPQGNYADMASIMVPYASMEEQENISTVLAQIRDTIAQNQRENQALAELRDALLPKLMSGEIDVSDVQL